MKRKLRRKRISSNSCELTHLQNPGSETFLSMVNQEDGQKSSLVGANALDPDTCDADGDYEEEEGQKYLDDCQEHKLNDQLRWHLYVCSRDTSRITRFWDDDDET